MSCPPILEDLYRIFEINTDIWRILQKSTFFDKKHAEIYEKYTEIYNNR